MKTKMYLVLYSTGSWDEWASHNIFVTENEEVARQYVKKFNRILTKWKSYFKQILEQSPDKVNDIDFYSRYIEFSETNRAYYNEIEIR